MQTTAESFNILFPGLALHHDHLIDRGIDAEDQGRQAGIEIDFLYYRFHLEFPSPGQGCPPDAQYLWSSRAVSSPQKAPPVHRRRNHS